MSRISFFLFMLFSLCLSVPTMAEENSAIYNAYVLDLGNAIYPKSMAKPWKKRSAAWQEEVKNSQSVEGLGKLVIELEQNLGEKATLEAWADLSAAWMNEVKDCKSYGTFGDYLIELEEGIKNEVKVEGWEEQREVWLGKITESNKKALMVEERVVLDASTFSSGFDKAWSGTSNGFKEMIGGSGTEVAGLGMLYDCSAKMPGAKSTRILQVKEEDSDVLKYMAIFDAGQYKENALELMENIKGMVGKLMNDNYAVKTLYLSGYMDQKVYAWEYVSDNFSTVMKNPSVTVGIRVSNGSYAVELLIAEPIFN